MGRCKHCVNFRSASPFGDPHLAAYGRCTLGQSFGRVPDRGHSLAVALTNYDPSGPLYASLAVEPDFGCIQFQAES